MCDVIGRRKTVGAYEAPQRHLQARPVCPVDVQDLHTSSEAATKPACPYQPAAGRQLLHEPGEGARIVASVCHVSRLLQYLATTKWTPSQLWPQGPSEHQLRRIVRSG